MCGIVGAVVKWSSGFITKTEDCFYEMLYADAVRGFDSTGVVGIEKDSTFHIAKEASDAFSFMQQLRVTKVKSDMWQRGKAYIGHNRKKTIGEIQDSTAHPFVIDSTFAMVHNGTLYNHENLTTEKVEVDSQALAIYLKPALESDTPKEALEEILWQIHGAYAIAAYDQKKHKLHLLRNKERPMSVFETSDGFFFSSEYGLAQWVLLRNGYSFKEINGKILEEDTLFTLDLETNTVTEEKLEKKSPPQTQKTSYYPMTQIGNSPGAATNDSVTGGSETTTRAKVQKKRGELSSAEIKRIKKAYLGKKIRFWCDGFVEKNFPKTIEDGETEIYMFGTIDEWTWQCVVNASVDIKPLEMKREVDIIERLWMGTLEALWFDDEQGCLVVEMVECKPIAQVPKQSINGTELRKILEYERDLEGKSDAELLNIKLHKFAMFSWQERAVESELKSRGILDENPAHYH